MNISFSQVKISPLLWVHNKVREIVTLSLKDLLAYTLTLRRKNGHSFSNSVAPNSLGFFLRFPFIDLSQFTIHWDIVEEPPLLVRFRLINFNKYSVKVDTKQKRQLERPTGNASRVM